jgi:hypothetical protein
MQMVEEKAPELLKIGEFAAQMRISIHTARQWSYRRRIATCKSGKLLLVPATEVNRLIAAGMRQHFPEEARVAA